MTATFFNTQIFQLDTQLIIELYLIVKPQNILFPVFPPNQPYFSSSVLSKKKYDKVVFMIWNSLQISLVPIIRIIYTEKKK